MDPLTITASTAGIISLGIQVTQSLIKFYSAYKQQKPDVARTSKKLAQLQTVLTALNEQIAKRNFRADEKALRESIEESIADCEDDIYELQEENDKLKTKPLDSRREAAKTVARRVAYPFRQTTLQKLDEDVESAVSHLNLALSVLGKSDINHVQDDIDDAREILNLVRADQISSNIREWLNAPDATVNYNAASKAQSGTGLWFVKGEYFMRWLDEENSFLWLHGLAGCGKSVLCATAIQHVYRHRRNNPRSGIAYFFFTFNEISKQDVLGMLKTLLLQLSTQLGKNSDTISEFYKSYGGATPTKQALLSCLRRLITEFDQVHVLLDALDESPRYEYRSEVLEALTDMRAWDEPRLHILVTSRNENDIRDVIQSVEGKAISLENLNVKSDIAIFVSQHLRTSRSLQHWKECFGEIELALTEGAHGVFRWVECQFKELQRCRKHKTALHQMLRSLPRSLDETYERMLLTIEQDARDEAKRILSLLCCAQRPLTPQEVVDAIAVELGDSPRLNHESKYFDCNGIFDVCPGLIALELDPKREYYRVKIAHFSVQEYLEGGRIDERVASFGISRPDAHAETALICLTYLLESAVSTPHALECGEAALYRGSVSSSVYSDNYRERVTTNEYSSNNPFLNYAAKHWHDHFISGSSASSQTKSLILKLFHNFGGAHDTWALSWSFAPEHLRVPSDSFSWGMRPLNFSLLGLEFHDPLQGLPMHNASLLGMEFDSPFLGLPIYNASFLGLEFVLLDLLQNRSNYRSNFVTDSSYIYDGVNEVSGYYTAPLLTAVQHRHEAVARLLLENGADINMKFGELTLLRVAIEAGLEPFARWLIANGANISSQRKEYLRELQAASKRGYTEIVKMLLEHTDQKPRNDVCGTALHYAVEGGHKRVVELLLSSGADVHANYEGYHKFKSALAEAAASGNKDIVELLLQRGARTHLEGENSWSCRDALHVAAAQGQDEIIRLLLDRGADVNAVCHQYCTALRSAAVEGHFSTVRLLLSAGASVDREHDSLSTAMIAASNGHHNDVVRHLLEAGADVNYQDDSGDTALMRAVDGNIRDADTVKLLLEAGADVNIESKKRRTALTAAAGNGRRDVVQLLLDAGADVNIECEEWGTALAAAARYRYRDIVQLLLDAGADVTLGSRGINMVLTNACFIGDTDIVRLFLATGIEVARLEGNFPGSAVAAASCTSNVELIQLLLESGTEVNSEAVDKERRSALCSASIYGPVEAVQLLLDHGASINSPDGKGDYALLAAAKNGNAAIVQLLLERGADVEVQDSRSFTVLHLASLSRSEATVRLAIEGGCGSLIDAQDQHGYTALHYAAKRGELEIVRTLLQSGANVNTQDENGVLALHNASRRGSLDIVRLLLAHGADASKSDQNRQNSLHCAAEGRKAEMSCVLYPWEYLEDGRDAVMRLLLESGVEPNAPDEAGKTALHYSSAQGLSTMAQLLLDHQADVNLRDNDGRTVIHYALARRDFNTIWVLLRYGANPEIQDMPGIEATSVSEDSFRAAIWLLDQHFDMTRSNGERQATQGSVRQSVRDVGDDDSDMTNSAR